MTKTSTDYTTPNDTPILRQNGVFVPNKEPNNTTSKFKTIIQPAIISISMGLLFGYVLGRSGVMLPAVIRAQFLFTRFAMLKMWLSGVGVSVLCNVFSCMRDPEMFNKVRTQRVWRDKGIVTLLAGGFIQGMGMAFTGACPGMTWGQMGSGVPYAPYTFLGAMLGAMLFSLVHPLINTFMIRDFQRTLKPWFTTQYLDVHFGVSYVKLASAFAVFVLAVVGIFEGLIFWGTDLTGVAGTRTLYTDLMNPALAGALIGVLQLPAYFLLSGFLGTSSAYSICTSQVFRIVPSVKAEFSYASNIMSSASWWQITYGLGAMLGGFMSATVMPPSTPSSPLGVGMGFALGGGILLVFGARLAGGCASGHGLTGLSLMSVTGFIVVPAMYAGAISTAAVLSRPGLMGDAAYFLYPN